MWDDLKAELHRLEGLIVITADISETAAELGKKELKPVERALMDNERKLGEFRASFRFLKVRSTLRPRGESAGHSFWYCEF